MEPVLVTSFVKLVTPAPLIALALVPPVMFKVPSFATPFATASKSPLVLKVEFVLLVKLLSVTWPLLSKVPLFVIAF